MALVVDVSIVAKWFIPDEKSAFAQLILEQVSGDAAYVPALFRWEIQNCLLNAERAARITADDVDKALEELRGLPIALEFPGRHFSAGSDVQAALRPDAV
jgi:predicted nucleic acid-binding protein